MRLILTLKPQAFEERAANVASESATNVSISSRTRGGSQYRALHVSSLARISPQGPGGVNPRKVRVIVMCYIALTNSRPNQHNKDLLCRQIGLHHLRTWYGAHYGIAREEETGEEH